MSKRPRRRQVLVAALPLLLAACAGLPPTQTEGEPPAVTQRALLDAIELAGRLSVRYQIQGRDEALHGNFSWSQLPEKTNVTLLSPLGQTMAIIEVTPKGATLSQAGQPVRRAVNVNELTANTLGWPLPVSGLREWLQGFAVDAKGNRFTATPGSTEVTTQDGWHIRYANWLGDESAPSTSRPKRIDLSRYTEQAGDVSIRIIIDTWQPR